MRLMPTDRGLNPNGKRLAGKSVLILGVSTLAIAMLAAPAAVSSAVLVWNMSPSAPAGLYSIEHDKWEVGDRVAVRPAALLADDLDRRQILPTGKLLLKRVVAGEGDVVCREAESVTVNGAVVATARGASAVGEPLPAWGGCTMLKASEVFLLGDTAASYDGRYFGVTAAQDVLGRVRMVARLH